MKNYTLLQEKYIEEIQSNVKIYRHNKTNARICTMENNDSNKVFNIAFRTPPINSTGLTHILEHSVLCGSKNYPVKDPFVELLKSSMNTFLNAMTFPDKTMYPCASQNDKDFKNLMSVYMDAVFYPRIYQFEEIFMQEGWHYHILNEEDPITYNGVVYNEMKGAFSNPEQVLFRSIIHSLYPDTPYSYESGGDPKYIPDLDFEQFKDFHSKFYHPSNSYIFIYGNCDMEERLTWLDENYLSNFDAIDFDTAIPYQEKFAAPVNENYYYPISKEDTLEDKTFLSYNLALPTTLDSKLMLACGILVSAILENPGAPLKQALIDANLGQDVQSVFDDGLLQPLLSIIIYNSNKELEDKFISVVETELEKLSNNLNKDLIESLINFFEFKAREQKFSSRMPRGLEVEMTCLNSWLYDENQPFNKLETLSLFAELKEELKTNYFENIIKEYFLKNTHKSLVKLMPSYTCAEEDELELTKKLEEYKNSLSKEELQLLIKKNKDLEVYQSTPSSLEEIATLPKLTIEDIEIEPEKVNLEVTNNDYKLLFNEYHTNDIAYVNYYFDLSKADKNTVLYLALFTDLIKHLSTDERHFTEINQLILRNTGGLGFSFSSLNTVSRECKLLFKLSYSCLTNKINLVNDLANEILFKTNFKDTKRLFERLSEIKAAKEMSAVDAGHVFSVIKAASYIDENSYYSDLISGISYNDFIFDIFNNFEAKKEEIISNLEQIKGLFAKDNFTLGFTGLKQQYNECEKVFNDTYASLNDNTKYSKDDFKPNKLNQAFKGQFNVNFVARAGLFDKEFNGALYVLDKAISLDYLWNQVRVLGGAYGCMMLLRPSGLIGFTSYRDPNISRTNDVYNNVVDFIKNLNPSDEELLKYKIGAMGNLQTVMHVSEKAAMSQLANFSGMTHEIKRKYRKEVVEATKEDLVSFAEYFDKALSYECICVIGNANLVEENKELFKEVRNLNK